MMYIIFCITFMFTMSTAALAPRIDDSESHYKAVVASTEDCSPGSVIANGQMIAVHSIRSNGNGADTYVMVVFDRSGGGEKIFSSSPGDIDATLDTSDPANQVTGNGTKKLQVCIVNDKTVTSPVVGGAYEAVNL